MKTITVTELARNLRHVLDRLLIDNEEIVVERNHQQVARILPGPGKQSALEAMANLFRVLPEKAADDWQKDGREYPTNGLLNEEIRDPWAT